MRRAAVEVEGADLVHRSEYVMKRSLRQCSAVRVGRARQPASFRAESTVHHYSESLAQFGGFSQVLGPVRTRHLRIGLWVIVLVGEQWRVLTEAEHLKALVDRGLCHRLERVISMAAADVMGMQVYQSNPAYRWKRETPERLTYGCNISGVAPVTVSFIYTTRDARTQRALGGGRAVCLSTCVHCRWTNN